MPTEPLAKKSWGNPGNGLRSTPVNDNEWGQTKFGSKEWWELSVGIILECLITGLIIMGVLWSQLLANTVGFLCFPLVWSTNHASVLMQTDCKKALSNVATTRAWSAREPRVLRSRKSTFSMLSILLRELGFNRPNFVSQQALTCQVQVCFRRKTFYMLIISL